MKPEETVKSAEAKAEAIVVVSAKASEPIRTKWIGCSGATAIVFVEFSLY